MNNERNVSESHFSNNGLQQDIAVGQTDDGDELLQNTSNSTIQVINSQSSSAHTTLTNNFAQNVALNNTTSTTSTILRGHDFQKNYVKSND